MPRNSGAAVGGGIIAALLEGDPTQAGEGVGGRSNATMLTTLAGEDWRSLMALTPNGK